ncbi:MAG: DUF3142 domain-containing protein [Armatimonadetes bacterium]|nr:DUF3142 domain-containing protein [Armatimonadota bacterium]
MKLRWVWAVLAVLLVGGLWLHFRRHRHPTTPLKTAYWYWQTPYSLSEQDAADLKKLDVKQIFVRAGTFSSDGQNLVLIIPQSYSQGSNRLPIHLVFNADAGVIHHFEDYDLSRITNQISTRIAAQVEAARKVGDKVIGVQLDFDIPTRLLPKYADLVRGIRQSNPLFARQKGFFFSLTGLLSWLGTGGVERLSSEVDFMIPQAYEGEVGLTPDKARPLFDPDDLRRRLPKAERLNCPYWIGIPAYGRAFLYDEAGHLRNSYRGLEAQDALRHPSFKLVEAYASDPTGKPATGPSNWVGEEILKFKAVRPALNGEGLGYTLVYNVPSPDVTAKALQIVDEERGDGCQGVVIYRMPEPGSSFTVPLDSIVKTFSKQEVIPKLSVKVSSSQDALETVESSRKDIPVDVYLEAENVGTGSSFIAPDAVDIRLQFDKSGFGDIRLRDFDSVSYAFGRDEKSEVEAPPNRANILHIRKGFMFPGQKLYCGPIRLLNSGQVRVTIRSRIRCQSGFSSQETQTPEALIRSGTGVLFDN